jgi:hypothetical protein
MKNVSFNDCESRKFWNKLVMYFKMMLPYYSNSMSEESLSHNIQPQYLICIVNSYSTIILLHKYLIDKYCIVSKYH